MNRVDAVAEKVDRLVRYLDREVIAGYEFFGSMVEALWNLSAEEKQAILGPLAGHPSETVRDELVRVQAFVRNQDLSRDFEHVRQNSPLRPGGCVELFSDHGDMSDDHSLWLGGRECRRVTFVRFERLRENLAPVAIVEFDEAIDMPGHDTPGHDRPGDEMPGHDTQRCITPAYKGRYGVLFARYGCDDPAWAQREGSVGMCIVEALPNDWGGFNDTHPFTDRHVRYRVPETPDEPVGSSG